MVGGFNYFDVIFLIFSEYYQGLINIENNARGKRLKDITKIKNITKDMVSRYGINPSYAFLRDASMNSIPDSDAKINPSDEISSEADASTKSLLRPKKGRPKERKRHVWRPLTISAFFLCLIGFPL